MITNTRVWCYFSL